MARFFDPAKAEKGTDLRLHAPATARNRDVIFEVLSGALPSGGTILELASGTGEHAAHMAPQLPSHTWQPTDIEPHHITSIDSWAAHTGAPNILPAQHLNILTHSLDDLPGLSAILAINLIHIAPWQVTKSLIEKAGHKLETGTILFLYGPYKRDDVHTSMSNEAFDQSLKNSNPDWGVRDMEAVTDLAGDAGFGAPEIVAMPANNFSLIFKKL